MENEPRLAKLRPVFPIPPPVDGLHQCKLDDGTGHCYTDVEGGMWLRLMGWCVVHVDFCPFCGVPRSDKAVQSDAPYTQAHYSTAARLVDRALIEAKGVDAGGVLRRMIAEELVAAEGRGEAKAREAQEKNWD